MKKNQTIIMAFLAIISLQSNAKELSIQQRLANLEVLVEQQAGARTNTSDVVIQNQKLQQQVAELKGVIEEQNYQIEKLQEKQKLLYIDVDSRLAELESNSTTTSSALQNSDLSIDEQAQSNVEVSEVDDNNSQVTVTNTTTQQEPVLSNYQDDYDIAFAHLRGGRFTESARAFEGFIQKYPNNELTDNAHYWLGESYYVKRQYPQALAAFQALTEKFPESGKAPDSWLKIGYSYYEMDDYVKANESLSKVINDYPNTNIARLASNRLRQLERDN